MRFVSFLKISTMASTLLVIAFSGSVQSTVITYTGGHSINESAANTGGIFLASGVGTSGVGTSDLSVSNTLAGLNGAFDAFVIGENGSSLSAAARTMISDYTAAGGHTVVLGSHGREAALLNDVFGFSVVVYGGEFCSYCDNPISRVTGTGPETLLGLNGSWFIDAAPGTLLYERDAGGDAAFVMDYGLGTVSWLAWDFCECSNLDSDETDWYSVLATSAVTSGGTVPEPSTLALLGLGLFGFAKRRSNGL